MKILVVTAAYDAARAIAMFFGLAGHEVSVANDDVSAVNLAMNRPAAVLFDGVDEHAVGLLRDVLGDEPVFVAIGTETRVPGVDGYILPPLDLNATEELLLRLSRESTRRRQMSLVSGSTASLSNGA